MRVNKESYTSASSFPSKLLHINPIEDKKIKPIHAQLILTNACNLNCSFCSCSDRDKKKKLTLKQIKNIIDILVENGCKAITITGGGEPLMYYEINEVISYASNKLKVGLVTNGILLKRLKYHNNLTWCRISSSDDRTPAYENIEYAIKINPKTDWAFSHVVTKNPNYEIIKGMIEFANRNNFTHIRLVSDLLDLNNVPDLDIIKKYLMEKNVNDNLVIYQGRKDSTIGTKNCYISLLKPVICPEGIFACCGIQYAIHGQKHDMIDSMKMGKVKDLNKILTKQECFDGSKCNNCYYQEYNNALTKLLIKPDHMEFV